MFKTIKNALKTPDVRKRLLYTLVLIVLFRLGCYITVPGVNTIVLNEAMTSSNGIAGFIDIISGGAFSRFSIFAMSISPYITASIVVQLLTFVIPSLLLGAIPVEIVKNLSISNLIMIILLTIFWFILSIMFFYKSLKKYESNNLFGFGS